MLQAYTIIVHTLLAKNHIFREVTTVVSFNTTIILNSVFNVRGVVVVSGIVVISTETYPKRNA